jgi:isopenicillin-N epimerase
MALTMTMMTTMKTTMMKIPGISNNNKELLLRHRHRHRHRLLSTHTKGYKAIGSFHSENVDMLMEQSDDDYKIPQLPFEPKKKSSHNVNNDEKNQYAGDDFLLDRKRWTFLNHGAFGAALKVGYDRAEQWRYHLERQPLRYFDRDLLPHMVYSARRIANFCNSSRDDITVIPNGTL